MQNLTLNAIRFAFITLCCSGLLAGCADGPSKYPSISSITDIGTILSPDERDKTVQSLQKEGQTQTQSAQSANSSVNGVQGK